MKWWLFPALGVLGAGAYVLGGRTVGVADAVFVGVGAASVTTVLVGIRVNRPVARTAWLLIAAGSGLWVLGDAAYVSIALTREAVPMLSVADIIYLLGYPVLAVGLYLLVHQGGRRGELGHVANSSIVMIAFGLLMWVFIVQPETVGVSRTAGIVGVAYPAMDVFLLGLLVHFIGSKQWQSVSFRLLTIALVATLLGDIAVDIAALTSAEIDFGVSGLGYLAYYILVGTAALHPSMRDLRPPVSHSRNSALAASFSKPTVGVLTAAIMTAPAVMAILLARGEDVSEWGWGVVLCSTLLVGLSLVRVNELLNLLHRQTDTLRGVAEIDHLTSLPNRNGLQRWVEQQWVEGQGEELLPLTVLILDIDRFEDINDTFGHGVGDDVLRAVAGRLRSAVGERGEVGRIGADEFAVGTHAALPDAVALARDMHASLERPVDVHGATLMVEASIGIASTEGEPDAVDPETVGRHAHLAMQAAKTAQPRIALYDVSMERDDSGRLRLLSELTTAIEQRELEVYYQLQVGLSTMSVVGVEALLRWNHPDRGLLEPDSFLPMAERTALIRPLLSYVLAEALSQRQRWSADGIDLTLSINISARNLLDGTLAEQVGQALETAGASPDVLTVELTETTSMTDLPVAIDSLDGLRKLGVGLAIDDYGTGYSSLSYLQRLPVQQLKIDKAFVMDMTTTLAHRIIVRSTIDLARTLGLTITAEGVEDRETLLELKRLSCHYAQGYHLGRPVPASEIPASITALDAQLSETIEVR